MAEPAATATAKPPKAKRVVKKRPLAIVYSGENLTVHAASRDMDVVIDALTSNTGAKVYKITG